MATKNFNVRIAEDTIRQIRSQAALAGMKVPEFTEMLLRDGLKLKPLKHGKRAA